MRPPHCLLPGNTLTLVSTGGQKSGTSLPPPSPTYRSKEGLGYAGAEGPFSGSEGRYGSLCLLHLTTWPRAKAPVHSFPVLHPVGGNHLPTFSLELYLLRVLVDFWKCTLGEFRSQLFLGNGQVFPRWTCVKVQVPFHGLASPISQIALLSCALLFLTQEKS